MSLRRHYRHDFRAPLLCLLISQVLFAAQAASALENAGTTRDSDHLDAAETSSSSEALAPVVVTAVMEESPLTVVTNPKAPRQPVPASDGADFLKSIPGFATLRKGGSNGDPELRGMSGSRINLLIDGGQIGGGCPSRMDPPTAYIAPELFDRVTIIKGPETVLYGPGSSAGTVLFDREHTRYAAPGWSMQGSLLGGSWGRNDQTLEVKAGTPDFYAEIVGNHTHSQDYEDGKGDRVHSSYDRWNTDATIGWTPDDDTRLQLDAGKGNGQAAYAFSSMDGAQFLRESLGLSFEKNHLTETWSKLEVRAYSNYADHVMDNYTLRDPDPNSMMPMAMASDVDRRTVGGRIAATFDWTNINLVVGIDGSSNVHRIRNGGPPGSNMGYYRDLPRERDARMSTTGAFAELAWSFADRERLVAGGRVDRANARGYGLASADASMGGMGDGGMDTLPDTPTVDASRHDTLKSGFARWEHALASSPVTVYAGIGHVERFPDYWELFGDHVDKTLPSFLGLAPEKTTQLDVGARYQDTKLQAWASVYAGVVDDFILMHYAADPMMGGSTASNVNARIAGGEAGMSYALTERWKVEATVTYAWGENRSEHHPLPQMPPFETRLSATYDTGSWSIGALLRAAASQDRIALGEGNIVGQDLGPTGGFGVLSFNGGYRFSKNLVLTAGVDNVFNKVYAEHINATNPGFVGYVNTLRVNEPGRTAWLKLGFSF